ncbi:MAG: DUF2721 domain-containing protein [Candidatus Hydrogenedens sp.]|nr:DUF2721 domain-containing protein [Candidatus Hydrogenedens sp.]
MTLHDLIPVLQVAIGPVILVSGVGLLLLSMTNRFGRIIDRTRQMVAEPSVSSAAQLEILMRRAHLLRAAIALGALSVLLAAVLIIVFFTAAAFHMEIAPAVATLFIACMLALIGALLLFMGDFNLSLTALKLEVDAARRG